MKARLLGLILLALAVAAPTRVRAASGRGELPVYVSARFKKVAKRAFRQVVTLKLEEACGDHPLCKPFVDTVTQAFTAAITGNATELRASLSGLFADSAVNGLLALALEELLDDQRIGDREKKIVKALVRCLARAMTDRRLDSRCFEDSVRTLASDLGGLDRWPAAAAAVKRLAAPANRHRAPSPTDVMDILNGMAGYVGRTDIATYLAGVRAVVAQGLDGGVFPAVHAAMRDEHLFDVASALASGQGHVVLAQGTTDDTAYLTAIAEARRLDPDHGADYDAWTAAYRRWASARPILDKGMKRAILLREPIDISALGAVFRAARKHALPKQLADPQRTLLSDFSFKAGMLLGVVRTQNFVDRYAVALLAAAVVVDYARTGDDAALLRDAKTTVLFAASLMALRGRAAIELATDAAKASHRRLREADEICEVKELAAILEIGPPVPAVGACYSVLDKKDRPLRATPTVPDAQRAALDELAKLFAGRVNLPLDDLRRVLRHLARGDGRAAARVIARIGIVAIMDRLDDVLTDVLSVDPEKCARDAGWTTIVRSTDARCAVFVLVTAAYDPVADYLWDAGTGANAPEVAEKVYRSFLDSRYLDSVPLVVNVGLGANQVWLQGSRTDFAALTLIDKFGVAVYKNFDRRKVFELGLFVGGFLDALVRTAADEGEDRRYWLGGANVGWTRINGADIGIEGHIAAAMPFELDKDEVGFAVGIAAIVPLDVVLTDEEE